MSQYSELLKHPLWQKKRLEVLSRADFACEECGDKDSTLHVHHSVYLKGRRPWEYEDRFLQCLCEKCHFEVTTIDSHFMQEYYSGLSISEKRRLVGYIRALDVDKHHYDYYPATYDEILGFSDYFWIKARNLIALFKTNNDDGREYIPYKKILSLIPAHFPLLKFNIRREK